MKRILLMICLAGACVFYVQSGSIPIHGSLMGMKRMSVGLEEASTKLTTDNISTAVPVVAQQNLTNVDVMFLSNLGNLTITVVNAQGYPVYQKMVNAVSGGKVTIDTSGWCRGSYSLVITNRQGGRLEGLFNVE